ncbi:MAG TPA: hypothetical protein VHM92_06595, partial [Allosphingosinicella sp.]|nr:hypothetical protein [Allosphingosinicella sp.]
LAALLAWRIMAVMDGATDDRGEEDGEEESPPARPRAFGMPAQPVGCGLAGAVLFALLTAPILLLQVAPDGCADSGSAACPWPSEGTGTGLALAAWSGAAFGLATGALVARRLALWREGRHVRPPLWVAFVALFAIAWGPGSVAQSLLVAAVAG